MINDFRVKDERIWFKKIVKNEFLSEKCSVEIINDMNNLNNNSDKWESYILFEWKWFFN